MNRPRVAIVDTGSGNLRSVEKALVVAGADVFISHDADAIARAEKVVVPGQGAFGGCVAGLASAGGALRQAVLGAIEKGTPFLGICLGLQVLFEGSDEDPTCQGLGVFPGRVVRFPFAATGGTGAAGDRVERRPAFPAGAHGGRSGTLSGFQAKLKVPHMGWNDCHRGRAAARTSVLADTPDGTSFYFVHSYFPVPADAGDVALEAEHGVKFCAAVARDNVFACQFHPEKSQAAGLALLRRFVSG